MSALLSARSQWVREHPCATQQTSFTYSAEQSENSGGYQSNATTWDVTVPAYLRSTTGVLTSSLNSTNENYSARAAIFGTSGTQSEQQTLSESYFHVESGNFDVSNGSYSVNIPVFTDLEEGSRPPQLLQPGVMAITTMAA